MTTNAADWPTAIAAITLVTEGLPATDRFYRDVFGLEPVHVDDDSTVRCSPCRSTTSTRGAPRSRTAVSNS